MIFTTLHTARQYSGLLTGLDIALEALQDKALEDQPVGRYEFDQGVYALVQEYQTTPLERGLYEAHRNYIDVQYVVRGQERFGYAPIASLQTITPYDAQTDCELLSGKGSLILMPAGSLAVLFACDAHMPHVDCEDQSAERPIVKKIVIKVPIGEI